MTSKARWAALTLCLIGAAACERGGDQADAPPAPADSPALAAVSFDTATAYVITGADTIALSVELAQTEDQRAYGLMDRDALPADAGMIFLYDAPQPAQSAFWMYRTRIPLDIAFFDSAGRIVSIVQMTPCRSARAELCPTYPAGAPYFGALEVNRGWMQQHGVEVGDRISVPGRVGG